MSTLDNVEQFDAKEYLKENPGVAIKGGIDMRDLRNQKDTEFELDEDDLQPTDEMQDVYFDKEKHFQQLNYECLNCGDDEDPATPFQRMAREMEDISPNKDGSVMKSILHHGAGTVVPENSLCRVHYNAYRELDDEPFDSSYLRNRQKQFKLGQGGTILGWEIGVPTMKRGETARFLFSPDYGYGKLGCPPRIPANAWTMFEIQLISFVDQEAADNFENFTKEEQEKLSFDEIVKVVESLRLTGTEAFNTNRYKLAINAYSQAHRMLENFPMKDEKEEQRHKQIVVKLCLNLSLCFLKQSNHARACLYARKVLDVDSRNVKALYRLAQALRNMGEYKEAKRRIYQASQLAPRDKAITEELNTLNAEMEKHKKKESGMAKRMFQMDIKTEPKPKPSPKPKTSGESEMLAYMKKVLTSFESDPEQKNEIRVPKNLTPEEISGLKETVQELGLFWYGTDGSYTVAKR